MYHSAFRVTEYRVLLPQLSANEARVIGCLMEKSVTTPEQYPLTLNALVNACNQKSSRHPVMSLETGTVERTVRDLEARHLVLVEQSFKSRVDKYTQRFCNTRFSELQLDEAEFAIVCLLLLRGPQTPGELRTRSARQHAFEDNAAVVATLNGLIDRDGEPLLVKLPRTPGRKDSEYTHLFSGDIDVDAYAAAAESERPSPSARVNASDLAARVTDLEATVAELRLRLEQLESG